MSPRHRRSYRHLSYDQGEEHYGRAEAGGKRPDAYEVVADWAKLPAGWESRDVAAVAVDQQDRVYVFNRGDHPMMVFDRDGNSIEFLG